MRSLSIVALAFVALACFTFSGCENGTATKDANSTSSGDHGHDHDGDSHGDDHDAHAGHDHDGGGHEEGAHEHGPNGGHLFTFSGDKFRAEWKHYSDNHVVRVIVLDKKAESAVPVAAESMTVRRTAGDDGTVFTLDAESPDAEGKTAVYSLDSQDLDIAMNLGVTIEMKVGDDTYSSVIPPHKPH